MDWKKLSAVSLGALALYVFIKRVYKGSRMPKLFTTVDDQLSKMPDLKYLIDNEHFIVCPFQSTDWFVKYCKERGINTSRQQLEQFERLGYLYPIARVEHPQNVFWFRNDHAHTLLKEGFLWQPSTQVFQPWEKFKGEKNRRKIESFYSIYQIYPLEKLLQSIDQLHIQPEKLVELNPDEIKAQYERILSNRDWIMSDHKIRSRFDLAFAICQIISNRYFPQTQSDRRTIRISSGHVVGGWDWDQYRSKWNAQAVFDDIGIDIRTLENLCYMLQADSQSVDPMERWHELIRFISIDQKKRLKGSAKLALTLYSMSEMLNIFHEDLTGKKVFLGVSSEESRDFIYGTGVTQNPLQYLEYLANEYHLNPRPLLILVVEGDGEHKHFPRLAEDVFGYSCPQSGIEIRHLGGVGGFEGSKKKDKYGALEKYIDSHHDKQSIVFVVLDNEGRAPTVKASLIGKQSIFFPKRTVTRDEYIYLWKHSIEHDNVTPDEIALALTDHCNGRYIFQPEEVEDCYASGRGNPLEDLFNEKTGGTCQFNKVDLLGNLFGLITSSSKEEFNRKWAKRPIIKLIEKVLVLASKNYQPQYQDAWTENQESGYFGHVTGQPEKDVKKFLEELS